ncbi:hypothetical protein GCM10027514_14790 [Azotobacter armeniacus]
MSGCYEISAQRWAMIEAIVSPPQRMGCPLRDGRQMLNGVFWILCSGAKWRDLPERYGPWKTVYQRFRQWRDGGTFEQVLRHLHLRLRGRQRCWKKGACKSRSTNVSAEAAVD